MTKKEKIILSSVIVFILLIGFTIYRADNSHIIETKQEAKTTKLDNPDLVYASTFWAGLCGNGKGEVGGCYGARYLYKTGRFTIESGFISEKDVREDNPIIEKDLGIDAVNQVIKKIKDSGVLLKSCPPGMINDVGWDQQVTINGVKNSFHNIASGCRDTFDQIDNLLNDEAKIGTSTHRLN